LNEEELVFKEGYENLPKNMQVDFKNLTRKPWTEPGSNVSDFFNFGFNEESWKIY
jgi:hypothetical protein